MSDVQREDGGPIIKSVLLEESEVVDGAFRRLSFTKSAFDRRHDEKNYGIGSKRRYFVLIGPDGAAVWDYSTGEYLPSVLEEYRKRPDFNERVFCQPCAGGICYHSPTPKYEWQKPGKCEWVAGGQCYCDGAFLAGEELMHEFLATGDEDYVWFRLRDFYDYHLAQKPGVPQDEYPDSEEDE